MVEHHVDLLPGQLQCEQFIENAESSGYNSTSRHSTYLICVCIRGRRKDRIHHKNVTKTASNKIYQATVRVCFKQVITT